MRLAIIDHIQSQIKDPHGEPAACAECLAAIDTDDPAFSCSEEPQCRLCGNDLVDNREYLTHAQLARLREIESAAYHDAVKSGLIRSPA